jgi:hypothetical protein
LDEVMPSTPPAGIETHGDGARRKAPARRTEITDKLLTPIFDMPTFHVGQLTDSVFAQQKMTARTVRSSF